MATPQPPGVRPAGFFALRSPLLPFGELVGGAVCLCSPAALGAPEGLDEAIRADVQALRARIAALLARPEVMDALFVASPDLCDGVEAWRRDPEGEKGRKVERSLVKYLSRMSSRSTPFGLFAGCSVGRVGERTALELAPRAENRRHTRLDMDYLALLVEVLSADPALRRELRYRPSSGLYRVGPRLHVVETRMREGARTHHLVAVDAAPHVLDTLRRAADGVTIAELAATLVDDEVSADDAVEFVEELIDSQLLVSELETAVTGVEPVHALRQVLGATAAGRAAAGVLGSVHAALGEMDRGGPGAERAAYEAATAELRALPAAVARARLYQVDMVKPVRQGTLGPDVVRELEQAVDWLARLHVDRPDALARFREAFAARYEERMVPLAEALDEEVGIGFRYEPVPAEAGPTAARTAALVELLLARRGDAAEEIVLADADLERLSGRGRAVLPDAFGVTATLGAASPAALDAGEFVVALNGGVHGPSGANLLGRFCHADPELHGRVREHLAAEEALRPGAAFAEIVHLPMGRLGNVLCRPVLRGWEIPFLGASGADRDAQLPLDDLLVSLADGRIVLHSRRLGREVVPRLTTAHNYASPTNLAAYQFLCALQMQGASTPGWDWGTLWSLPYLPRVRHGRIVFSRARWRIDADHLRGLARPSRRERYVEAQRLRTVLRLPRLVLLTDGDNQLLTDLDDPLSVDVFADAVKNRPFATVVEMYPAPDRLCLRGSEGRFTHELVVPFERVREPTPAAPARVPAPAAVRTFPPGSEWLYVKLYTGPGVAEQVLREVVAPVAHAAEREGLVDRWFFLRYADPEPHLRLRFHGDASRLAGGVLPRLHEAAAEALADGRIWRMQVDTYQREVERYGGGRGIGLAEELFHVDSVAALRLLSAYPGDAGARQRWLLAIRGVDELLRGLIGAGLEARKEFLARSLAAPPAQVRRQWSDAFRAERAAIEQVLRADAGTAGPLAEGLRIIRARSERLAPVIARLNGAEAAGELDRPVQSMVLSYTHMSVNRLLRENQKEQERVMYHHLARTYDSFVARRARTAPG